MKSWRVFKGFGHTEVLKRLSFTRVLKEFKVEISVSVAARVTCSGIGDYNGSAGGLFSGFSARSVFPSSSGLGYVGYAQNKLVRPQRLRTPPERHRFLSTVLTFSPSHVTSAADCKIIHFILKSFI